MIETFHYSTLLYSTLLYCAHCQATLFERAEREFGDCIVRRLECSTKNVLDCELVSEAITPRLAATGWRQ